MNLGEASTPPGMRIYAIGDVHGRDDLLDQVHRAIEGDLAELPAMDHRIIHIGDLVDRGPSSAQAVERIRRLSEEDGRVLCVAGNHEDILLGFLDDPVSAGPTFIRFGGVQTMASYGLTETFARGLDELPALRDRFLPVLPEEHQRFIRELPFSLRFGDYLFCHAGIRPGIPLAEQDPHDLMWIREDFLRDRRDHGVVVIHGHTPVDAPEVRPNRIDIDTGAFATGRLTCLVLEGTGYRFL